LVRHGETQWSAAGKHTGRTDIPLSPQGRAHASALRGRLSQVQSHSLVLRSPLLRAAQTAELAGYADRAEICDNLTEWHYGDYEGLTTEAIRVDRPDWSLWRDGAPAGESPAEVFERVDRVVDRLLAAEGDVVAFAHGHLLRVVAARWLGLLGDAGRLLALSAGSVSVLGWERDTRVLRLWNDTSHIDSPAAVR